MIKSFSGQVVFCFAILRAISAYVGENRLSQYIVTKIYYFDFPTLNRTNFYPNASLVRKKCPSTHLLLHLENVIL